MNASQCRQRKRDKHVVSCVATTLLLLLCGDAWASPWVLPKGTTVLQLQYRTEFADREFLPDGDNQAFPLNGEFGAQSVELGLRTGLGYRFEASMLVIYKSVDFTADPVFVSAQNSAGEVVPVTPIFSFSEQLEGLADIHFALRYNAVDGPVKITGELDLKVPSGYDKPEGTFENDTPNVIDPETADGSIPEGEEPIRDDLTLGDGQVDVTAQLLFGTFIPQSRTFAKANGGFRLRFNGPGEQAVWGVKVGQFIGDHIVIFSEVSGTHTVIKGDIIGKSFATRFPETPALGFPLANFDFIDLRLDKDIVDVSGGFLLKFDRYEVVVSGGKIVDGSNVAELLFASVGSLYRF